ncbi:MAG TPA: bifunctional adenosylcobinamide kinase/adenosylcobinamide-phosphate guanylyltransferase [Nitrospiraceae bacterium]|jgi:adenosylcobinamide kinase/adenosylcobinamide-phosphate guanylyltransferase
MKTRKAAGKLILVLGGTASGKSQAALEAAGRARPKAFVATGQARDREMAERIARHRTARSADWATVEVPVELAAWFRRHGNGYRTIVLDCLTLWLSNLQGKRARDTEVSNRVTDLLEAIRSTPARVVVVSNELGLGLVPTGRSARSFRDLAGRVNQQVAAEADEVYLAVSGLLLRLK